MRQTSVEQLHVWVPANWRAGVVAEPPCPRLQPSAPQFRVRGIQVIVAKLGAAARADIKIGRGLLEFIKATDRANVHCRCLSSALTTEVFSALGRRFNE